jgi:hypothetical protein
MFTSMKVFKGYIFRDQGVCWRILEISIIAPILNTQKMHVHMKHNEGSLVVFHMLLTRVHLGPTLTKLKCLHMLLATFIKNSM